MESSIAKFLEAITQPEVIDAVRKEVWNIKDGSELDIAIKALRKTYVKPESSIRDCGDMDHPYGCKHDLPEQSYPQRFEEIRKITNSMFVETTDPMTAACLSDIRCACNRYEREIAKRGAI